MARYVLDRLVILTEQRDYHLRHGEPTLATGVLHPNDLAPDPVNKKAREEAIKALKADGVTEVLTKEKALERGLITQSELEKHKGGRVYRLCTERWDKLVAEAIAAEAERIKLRKDKPTEEPETEEPETGASINVPRGRVVNLSEAQRRQFGYHAIRSNGPVRCTTEDLGDDRKLLDIQIKVVPQPAAESPARTRLTSLSEPPTPPEERWARARLTSFSELPLVGTGRKPKPAPLDDEGRLLARDLTRFGVAVDNDGIRQIQRTLKELDPTYIFFLRKSTGLSPRCGTWRAPCRSRRAPLRSWRT